MHGSHPKPLVEEFPFLLTLFGSSHPIRCLLFALPLAMGFGWVGLSAQIPALHVAGLVLAGIAYWSLFEYGMHRWFYHWRPKHRAVRRVVEAFHVHHHRHITDRRLYNAGPLLALPLTVLLGAPVYLVTWSLPHTALILMGTLIGYYIYEWTHFLVHVPQVRWRTLDWLRRFHFVHHYERIGANFGVTNPLWDIVFGTYAEPDS